MLIVVGALVPGDRFELTPSITLPCSAWAVLLHPGSTNSSGVVRVAAAALETMMRRQHPHDIAAAQKEYEALMAADAAAAAGDAAQDDGENGTFSSPPAKRPKFAQPARRQILAGGGSLAAMGLCLSLPKLAVLLASGAAIVFALPSFCPFMCAM